MGALAMALSSSAGSSRRSCDITQFETCGNHQAFCEYRGLVRTSVAVGVLERQADQFRIHPVLQDAPTMPYITLILHVDEQAGVIRSFFPHAPEGPGKDHLGTPASGPWRRGVSTPPPK